ncbi:MAG TPA: hypothetical protein VG348_02315 [Acidimicrobiia bacterium]|jgi:predicted metal-dependent hydrolase|nr:hypothetical protein [Acidimicrobiia bacterium]
MSVDPVLIVPIALGALAVVALLAWRLPRRWRMRRRLRGASRKLDSFDPDERARTGVAVAELGLTRRTAKVLLHALSREEDRRVQFAIALAVVRARSERFRRKRVQRLRRWAVERLVENGHPVHRGLEWQQPRKRSRIALRAAAPQT